MSELKINDLVSYEIAASWWASLLPFNWMLDLAAFYLTYKTKRKYKRYQRYKHLQLRQELIKNKGMR